MAETYKILGQSAPSAATLTTLYTVPGATSAILSTMTVSNRSSTATTFRYAIRPAGASIVDAHYGPYDHAIGDHEFLVLTLGFGLATTDVVSVYNTLATVSFTLGGMEIT